LAFINICSIIYIYNIEAATAAEHAYYLSNKDIIITKPCRKYYGRLITSGKNLPAFLQHLAAFGGQMRIPRTTTCSVWYQLRCGILPYLTMRCGILLLTAVFNNAVQHTAVFNNLVQLIAHFALNAQLIYNALLAHSVYNALLVHSVHNALLAYSIYLTHFKQ